MAKKNKAKRKSVPAKQPDQQAKPTRQVAQVERFAGPLPHPEILHRYNQVLHGAADRIIAMAESQSAHRQDLERIVVEAGARDSLLGIISGCVIGLAAIAGGVFLAYNGKEIGGSIFTGIGLGSLVGVFIYGTRQRKQERERKHSQVR